MLKAIETAINIPPSIDKDGQFKQVDLLAMFEEFMRKSNVTDDPDKFLRIISPEEMMLNAGGGGSGGGDDSLGAVRPGDTLGQNKVSSGAGVRKEMR